MVRIPSVHVLSGRYDDRNWSSKVHSSKLGVKPEGGSLKQVEEDGELYVSTVVICPEEACSVWVESGPVIVSWYWESGVSGGKELLDELSLSAVAVSV